MVEMRSRGVEEGYRTRNAVFVKIERCFVLERLMGEMKGFGALKSPRGWMLVTVHVWLNYRRLLLASYGAIGGVLIGGLKTGSIVIFNSARDFEKVWLRIHVQQRVVV
jgi:hypothetical protein